MAHPANPRRILAESFYERFFFNDLLGDPDDPQLSSANLMAMLVFPGLLCLHLIPKYYVTLRYAPEHVLAVEALGDRYLWFAYSMSVLGLLAALQWDRLFPDERDYFVIGPQPVPTRAMFEAQALALGRYLGVFALLIHIGSAVFFPLGVAPRNAGLLEGLGFSIAHWLCLALASLFVVTAVAGLQGVLLALLPVHAFKRLSGVVQLLLALTFCALIILLPALRFLAFADAERIGDLVGAGGALAWLPPLWFALLEHWFASGFPSEVAQSAWRALAMTGGAFALAVASYWWGYRRFLRRSLESPQSGRRAWGSRALWRSLILGSSGSERAAASFTLKTLSRSPRQRLEFGGWLAVGVALVAAQSWRLTPEAFETPNRFFLVQTFLLLLVGLAGLRRAYELPAELPAHWVFRLHADRDPALYHRGARRATCLATAAPLGALSAGIAFALWGSAVAWVHAAAFALVAMAAVEGMRLGTKKIPFTCGYAAARAHVIIVWTLSAAGILIASSALGKWELAALSSPWLLIPAAVLTAGLAVLRTAIEEDETRERELLFEESSDPFPHRLRLNG